MNEFICLILIVLLFDRGFSRPATDEGDNEYLEGSAGSRFFENGNSSALVSGDVGIKRVDRSNQENSGVIGNAPQNYPGKNKAEEERRAEFTDEKEYKEIGGLVNAGFGTGKQFGVSPGLGTPDFIATNGKFKETPASIGMSSKLKETQANIGISSELKDNPGSVAISSKLTSDSIGSSSKYKESLDLISANSPPSILKYTEIPASVATNLESKGIPGKIAIVYGSKENADPANSQLRENAAKIIEIKENTDKLIQQAAEKIVSSAGDGIIAGNKISDFKIASTSSANPNSDMKVLNIPELEPKAEALIAIPKTTIPIINSERKVFNKPDLNPLNLDQILSLANKDNLMVSQQMGSKDLPDVILRDKYNNTIIQTNIQKNIPNSPAIPLENFLQNLSKQFPMIFNNSNYGINVNKTSGMVVQDSRLENGDSVVINGEVRNLGGISKTTTLENTESDLAVKIPTIEESQLTKPEIQRNVRSGIIQETDLLTKCPENSNKALSERENKIDLIEINKANHSTIERVPRSNSTYGVFLKDRNNNMIIQNNVQRNYIPGGFKNDFGINSNLAINYGPKSTGIYQQGISTQNGRNKIINNINPLPYNSLSHDNHYLDLPYIQKLIPPIKNYQNTRSNGVGNKGLFIKDEANNVVMQNNYQNGLYGNNYKSNSVINFGLNSAGIHQAGSYNFPTPAPMDSINIVGATTPESRSEDNLEGTNNDSPTANRNNVYFDYGISSTSQPMIFDSDSSTCNHASTPNPNSYDFDYGVASTANPSNFEYDYGAASTASPVDFDGGNGYHHTHSDYDHGHKQEQSNYGGNNNVDNFSSDFLYINRDSPIKTNDDQEQGLDFHFPLHFNEDFEKELQMAAAASDTTEIPQWNSAGHFAPPIFHNHASPTATPFYVKKPVPMAPVRDFSGNDNRGAIGSLGYPDLNRNSNDPNAYYVSSTPSPFYPETPHYGYSTPSSSSSNYYETATVSPNYNYGTSTALSHDNHTPSPIISATTPSYYNQWQKLYGNLNFPNNVPKSESGLNPKVNFNGSPNYEKDLMGVINITPNSLLQGINMEGHISATPSYDTQQINQNSRKGKSRDKSRKLINVTPSDNLTDDFDLDDKHLTLDMINAKIHKLTKDLIRTTQQAKNLYKMKPSSCRTTKSHRFSTRRHYTTSPHRITTVRKHRLKTPDPHIIGVSPCGGKAPPCVVPKPNVIIVQTNRPPLNGNIYFPPTPNVPLVPYPPGYPHKPPQNPGGVLHGAINVNLGNVGPPIPNVHIQGAIIPGGRKIKCGNYHSDRSLSNITGVISNQPIDRLLNVSDKNILNGGKVNQEGILNPGGQQNLSLIGQNSLLSNLLNSTLADKAGTGTGSKNSGALDLLQILQNLLGSNRTLQQGNNLVIPITLLSPGTNNTIQGKSIESKQTNSDIVFNNKRITNLNPNAASNKKAKPLIGLTAPVSVLSKNNVQHLEPIQGSLLTLKAPIHLLSPNSYLRQGVSQRPFELIKPRSSGELIDDSDEQPQNQNRKPPKIRLSSNEIEQLYAQLMEQVGNKNSGIPPPLLNMNPMNMRQLNHLRFANNLGLPNGGFINGVPLNDLHFGNAGVAIPGPPPKMLNANDLRFPNSDRRLPGISSDGEVILDMNKSRLKNNNRNTKPKEVTLSTKELNKLLAENTKLSSGGEVTLDMSDLNKLLFKNVNSKMTLPKEVTLSMNELNELLAENGKRLETSLGNAVTSSMSDRSKSHSKKGSSGDEKGVTKSLTLKEEERKIESATEKINERIFDGEDNQAKNQDIMKLLELINNHKLFKTPNGNRNNKKEDEDKKDERKELVHKIDSSKSPTEITENYENLATTIKPIQTTESNSIAEKIIPTTVKPAAKKKSDGEAYANQLAMLENLFQKYIESQKNLFKGIRQQSVDLSEMKKTIPDKEKPEFVPWKIPDLDVITTEAGLITPNIVTDKNLGEIEVRISNSSEVENNEERNLSSEDKLIFNNLRSKTTTPRTKSVKVKQIAGKKKLSLLKLLKPAQKKKLKSAVTENPKTSIQTSGITKADLQDLLQQITKAQSDGTLKNPDELLESLLSKMSEEEEDKVAWTGPPLRYLEPSRTEDADYEDGERVTWKVPEKYLYAKGNEENEKKVTESEKSQKKTTSGLNLKTSVYAESRKSGRKQSSQLEINGKPDMIGMQNQGEITAEALRNYQKRHGNHPQGVYFEPQFVPIIQRPQYHNAGFYSRMLNLDGNESESINSSVNEQLENTKTEEELQDRNLKEEKVVSEDSDPSVLKHAESNNEEYVDSESSGNQKSVAGNFLEETEKRDSGRLETPRISASPENRKAPQSDETWLKKHRRRYYGAKHHRRKNIFLKKNENSEGRTHGSRLKNLNHGNLEKFINKALKNGEDGSGQEKLIDQRVMNDSLSLIQTEDPLEKIIDTRLKNDTLNIIHSLTTRSIDETQTQPIITAKTNRRYSRKFNEDGMTRSEIEQNIPNRLRDLEQRLEELSNRKSPKNIQNLEERIPVEEMLSPFVYLANISKQNKRWTGNSGHKTQDAFSGRKYQNQKFKELKKNLNVDDRMLFPKNDPQWDALNEARDKFLPNNNLNEASLIQAKNYDFDKNQHEFNGNSKKLVRTKNMNQKSLSNGNRNNKNMNLMPNYDCNKNNLYINDFLGDNNELIPKLLVSKNNYNLPKQRNPPIILESPPIFSNEPILDYPLVDTNDFIYNPPPVYGNDLIYGKPKGFNAKYYKKNPKNDKLLAETLSKLQPDKSEKINYENSKPGMKKLPVEKVEARNEIPANLKGEIIKTFLENNKIPPDSIKTEASSGNPTDEKGNPSEGKSFSNTTNEKGNPLESKQLLDSTNEKQNLILKQVNGKEKGIAANNEEDNMESERNVIEGNEISSKIDSDEANNEITQQLLASLLKEIKARQQQKQNIFADAKKDYLEYVEPKMDSSADFSVDSIENNLNNNEIEEKRRYKDQIENRPDKYKIEGNSKQDITEENEDKNKNSDKIASTNEKGKINETDPYLINGNVAEAIERPESFKNEATLKNVSRNNEEMLMLQNEINQLGDRDAMELGKMMREEILKQNNEEMVKLKKAQQLKDEGVRSEINGEIPQANFTKNQKYQSESINEKQLLDGEDLENQKFVGVHQKNGKYKDNNNPKRKDFEDEIKVNNQENNSNDLNKKLVQEKTKALNREKENQRIKDEELKMKIKEIEHRKFKELMELRKKASEQLNNAEILELKNKAKTQINEEKAENGGNETNERFSEGMPKLKIKINGETEEQNVLEPEGIDEVKHAKLNDNSDIEEYKRKIDAAAKSSQTIIESNVKGQKKKLKSKLENTNIFHEEDMEVKNKLDSLKAKLEKSEFEELKKMLESRDLSDLSFEDKNFKAKLEDFKARNKEKKLKEMKYKKLDSLEDTLKSLMKHYSKYLRHHKQNLHSTHTDEALNLNSDSLEDYKRRLQERKWRSRFNNEPNKELEDEIDNILKSAERKLRVKFYGKDRFTPRGDFDDYETKRVMLKKLSRFYEELLRENGKVDLDNNKIYSLQSKNFNQDKFDAMLRSELLKHDLQINQRNFYELSKEYFPEEYKQLLLLNKAKELNLNKFHQKDLQNHLNWPMVNDVIGSDLCPEKLKLISAYDFNQHQNDLGLNKIHHDLYKRKHSGEFKGDQSGALRENKRYEVLKKLYPELFKIEHPELFKIEHPELFKKDHDESIDEINPKMLHSELLENLNPDFLRGKHSDIFRKTNPYEIHLKDANLELYKEPYPGLLQRTHPKLLNKIRPEVHPTKQYTDELEEFNPKILNDLYLRKQNPVDVLNSELLEKTHPALFRDIFNRKQPELSEEIHPDVLKEIQAEVLKRMGSKDLKGLKVNSNSLKPFEKNQQEKLEAINLDDLDKKYEDRSEDAVDKIVPKNDADPVGSKIIEASKTIAEELYKKFDKRIEEMKREGILKGDGIYDPDDRFPLKRSAAREVEVNSEPNSEGFGEDGENDEWKENVRFRIPLYGETTELPKDKLELKGNSESKDKFESKDKGIALSKENVSDKFPKVDFKQNDNADENRESQSSSDFIKTNGNAKKATNNIDEAKPIREIIRDGEQENNRSEIKIREQKLIPINENLNEGKGGTTSKGETESATENSYINKAKSGENVNQLKEITKYPHGKSIKKDLNENESGSNQSNSVENNISKQKSSAEEAIDGSGSKFSEQGELYLEEELNKPSKPKIGNSQRSKNGNASRNKKTKSGDKKWRNKEYTKDETQDDSNSNTFKNKSNLVKSESGPEKDFLNQMVLGEFAESPTTENIDFLLNPRLDTNVFNEKSEENKKKPKQPVESNLQIAGKLKRKYMQDKIEFDKKYISAEADENQNDKSTREYHKDLKEKQNSDAIKGNQNNRVMKGSQSDETLERSQNNKALKENLNNKRSKENQNDETIGHQNNKALKENLDNEVSKGNNKALKDNQIDQTLEGGRNNKTLKGNPNHEALKGSQNYKALKVNQNDETSEGRQNNKDLKGNQNDETLEGSENSKAFKGNRNDETFKGNQDNKALKYNKNEETLRGSQNNKDLKRNQNEETLGNQNTKASKVIHMNETVKGKQNNKAFKDNRKSNSELKHIPKDFDISEQINTSGVIQRNKNKPSKKYHSSEQNESINEDFEDLTVNLATSEEASEEARRPKRKYLEDDYIDDSSVPDYSFEEVEEENEGLSNGKGNVDFSGSNESINMSKPRKKQQPGEENVENRKKGRARGRSHSVETREVYKVKMKSEEEGCDSKKGKEDKTRSQYLERDGVKINMKQRTSHYRRSNVHSAEEQLSEDGDRKFEVGGMIKKPKHHYKKRRLENTERQPQENEYEVNHEENTKARKKSRPKKNKGLQNSENQEQEELFGKEGIEVRGIQEISSPKAGGLDNKMQRNQRKRKSHSKRLKPQIESMESEQRKTQNTIEDGGENPKQRRRKVKERKQSQQDESRNSRNKQDSGALENEARKRVHSKKNKIKPHSFEDLNESRSISRKSKKGRKQETAEDDGEAPAVGGLVKMHSSQPKRKSLDGDHRRKKPNSGDNNRNRKRKHKSSEGDFEFNEDNQSWRQWSFETSERRPKGKHRNIGSNKYQRRS